MFKRKFYLWITIALLVIIAAAFFYVRYQNIEMAIVDEPVVVEEIPVMMEYGIPVNDYRIEDGVIKKNQTFGSLMHALNIDASLIYQLTQAADTIFDVRKIQAGKPYSIFYTTDSLAKPVCFVYEETTVDYILFDFRDSIRVSRNSKPVNTITKYGEAVITSSLWKDMKDNNLHPLLTMELSDIYAWTIDFFGLQKGDKLKVIYDERYVDSTIVDIGDIHATCFTHNGVDYYAFYYLQNETPGYWNENGENLRKAFLKAPLKFSRISSGFSYARLHPVYKIVRPHTGVDYSAPTGTPVMSIGDGTVIYKQYQNGGGNTVKIRHNSVYTTGYLHLRQYATGLSIGKHVKQGEIIGYVGSTGTSTGPHLDFRVWQNNKPINPLKMQSPPAEPIMQENRTSYQHLADSLRRQLDAM